MKTKLLYLTDSYANTMKAKILDVGEDSPGKYRIILDQTVFYPLGGGQPTDQGKLKGSFWEGDVNQVLMKDGEVVHFVNSLSAPKKGMEVEGLINWERRYKNMRVHSAGHVVDFAMYLLGYSRSPLMPNKGDHGKKPYIIYEGNLKKDIQKELEEKSNDLIKQNLEFSWEFVSFEKLKKEAIYLQPGLPINKPLRKITLEGVGSVADGGTQIRKTSEVGRIKITSIETGGGLTKVNYQINSI